MSGFGFASNRRFDADSNKVTGIPPHAAANSLTLQLFPSEIKISPTDIWFLELKLAGNPCLRGASSSDTEEFALGEVQDLVLTLEFETQINLRTV